MGKDVHRQQKISRRSFFGVVGTLAKYGAISYGLGKLGIDVATYSPHYKDTFIADGFEPGWLETRHPERPPFIVDGYGEKEYLRYMAFNDDLLLRRTHAVAFGEFIQPRKKRITLKESVWNNLVVTYEELKHTTAHVSDVVHASWFSLASMFSNFYSVGDIYQAFGVYDENKKQSVDSDFDIAGYPNSVPEIFDFASPGDVSTIEHVAGFAAIGSLFMYATEHRLPEAKNIPLLAQLITKVGRNTKNKAIIFGVSGEAAWELYESKRWAQERWREMNWEESDEGIFSDDFNRDFLASMIGLNLGLRLYGDIDGDELYQRCQILDDPIQLVPAELLKIIPAQ